MNRSPLLLLLLVLLSTLALAGMSSDALAAPCSPGDDDTDGIENAFEDLSGNGDCDDDDTDADALPDYLDFDDDGDAVATPDEAPDANGDGDPADALDSDGDGLPDYLDADDDDDGILTLDEDANGDGDPTNDDSDGDGIPDYLDDVSGPVPSVPALGPIARVLTVALSVAVGVGISRRSPRACKR